MGKTYERPAKQRKRSGLKALRSHNRVNVSKPSASSAAAATAGDYRGMLPDALAILNENTRLRGEVVRLRAENARLKMASER